MPDSEGKKKPQIEYGKTLSGTVRRLVPPDVARVLFLPGGWLPLWAKDLMLSVTLGLACVLLGALLAWRGCSLVTMDRDAWVTFANTGWQAWATLLTLSATVVVLVAQAASTRNLYRVNLTFELARRIWFRLILLFGFVTLVVWVIAAAAVCSGCAAMWLNSAVICTAAGGAGIALWYLYLPRLFEESLIDRLIPCVFQESLNRAVRGPAGGLALRRRVSQETSEDNDFLRPAERHVEILNAILDAVYRSRTPYDTERIMAKFTAVADHVFTAFSREGPKAECEAVRKVRGRLKDFHSKALQFVTSREHLDLSTVDAVLKPLDRLTERACAKLNMEMMEYALDLLRAPYRVMIYTPGRPLLAEVRDWCAKPILYYRVLSTVLEEGNIPRDWIELLQRHYDRMFFEAQGADNDGLVSCSFGSRGS